MPGHRLRLRPLLDRSHDRPAAALRRSETAWEDRTASSGTTPGPCHASPTYGRFSPTSRTSPSLTARSSTRRRLRPATTRLHRRNRSLDPMPGFVSLDPPLHTRLRQALSGPLRPRPVSDWRATSAGWPGYRLDQLYRRAASTCGVNMPGRSRPGVMCLIVGLPVERAPLVQELANALDSPGPRTSRLDRGGVAGASQAG